MSFWKDIAKPFESAAQAANQLVADTGRGIGEISRGNIQGGIGKITDSYSERLVDYATLGNRSTFDAFTGGGTDVLKGSYRGNSKDLIRGGAVVGAGLASGGTAAFATNQLLAQRGVNASSLASSLSLNTLGVDLVPTARPQPIMQGFSDGGIFEQGYNSSMSGYDANRPVQSPLPIILIGGGALIALVLLLKKK